MADEHSSSKAPGSPTSTSFEPGSAGAPAPPARGDVPAAVSPLSQEDDPAEDDVRSAERSERAERGITDFVRRAVSAGVVAAGRSKDDIMRAAGGEIRGWLDHLNLDEEITKALAKMVIEVKTEIRFRPTDDGKIVSESRNDVKVKSPR